MPCGISRGLQTLPGRSMPRPTGRHVPKLTWLYLTLARSATSHPFGWRILLRQQLLQAPVTVSFALSSHREAMHRHIGECGLYELYAKALKVTNKKNKVAFKDILNYIYYCWPLATCSFYNMILPLHGFLVLNLLTHSASDLSLLCPVLSHLPSSSFETVWLLPIRSLPSNKDRTNHFDKWVLFIAKRWSKRNLKKKSGKGTKPYILCITIW